ncbi:MAG: hypothetical protein A2143_09780 [Gallionellales bacterium RBG_16_57_15]|nr:MAG: hypothetical protein A2143_09780 [Gallionellales bacterium RBG_16_57_15]
MNAAVYQEPYRLPAGILAIAVHGAFFALLYFGFTWQTLSPATMSVELWQSLPDRVDAPPVQPEIEKAVPPPPEKIVEPEVAPPQPEKIVEPEIVLPDKKTEIKPVEAKPDEKKKPAPVPEKKVKPKPTRQEMEARIAEQAAREQAAQAARERIEQARRDARERAEQAERAARERAEQAAATGRVVDEYTGKIVSKIRRNIVMPPDVADDARAEFSVTLLPGGRVLSARLTRSSGNAAYDNAVERAILKSEPLPLPADMGLFSRFRELELVFKPIE